MVRRARMSTATLPVRGAEDTAAILASKIAKIQTPRLKRRGSVLRREALERLQQGNAAEPAAVDEDADGLHGDGKHAVGDRGTLVEGVQLQQRPTDGTHTVIIALPPPRKGKCEYTYGIVPLF